MDKARARGQDVQGCPCARGKELKREDGEASHTQGGAGEETVLLFLYKNTNLETVTLRPPQATLETT